MILHRYAPARVLKKKLNPFGFLGRPDLAPPRRRRGEFARRIRLGAGVEGV